METIDAGRLLAALDSRRAEYEEFRDELFALSGKSVGWHYTDGRLDSMKEAQQFVRAALVRADSTLVTGSEPAKEAS